MFSDLPQYVYDKMTEVGRKWYFMPCWNIRQGDIYFYLSLMGDSIFMP